MFSLTQHVAPGLWPPRERAHGREERGWPPSLLKAPAGLCWPQEATETVLRVPGAAALCFPVLSFMGRGPCKAWAALPEPRPGPHLGHSPLFALDSGRCMACQSLPSLPYGYSSHGDQTARSCNPCGKPVTVTWGSAREKASSERWGCVRAPSPLLTSYHESDKGRTGLNPSWLRNRLFQP